MIHKPIPVDSLHENIFTMLNKEWMLITAGREPSFNTMTASWGGFGILWNRPVAYIVVRPTRYTYEFIEREERFSLSFFGREQREALKLCGSKSGRDIDKITAAGLTLTLTDAGTPYFDEARLVFECVRLYHHDIDPANFRDPSIDTNYPQKDYHRLYVGEIVTLLDAR